MTVQIILGIVWASIFGAIMTFYPLIESGQLLLTVVANLFCCG